MTQSMAQNKHNDHTAHDHTAQANPNDQMADASAEPDSPHAVSMSDVSLGREWQLENEVVIEHDFAASDWQSAVWSDAFDTTFQKSCLILSDFVLGLITDKSFHVSCRWTDNDEMQSLNLQFRGKDNPTNVLSFPSDDGPIAPDDALGENQADCYLGDLAFGYQIMAKEARDMGISLEDHMAHLMIHGLLHLIGFDHEMDDEAEEMEALESAALALIGVANPYAEADL